MSNPFLKNPVMVACMRLIRQTESNEIVESLPSEDTRVFFRFTDEGFYITDVIDVGRVMTSFVSVQIEKQLPVESSITLQISTSEDGSSWSDFNNLVQGNGYTCRYLKFKVLMTAAGAFTLPSISVWVETIDVPDVIKAGSDAVAIGGATISYGYNFFAVPHVVASGLGGNAKADIISTGKDSFIVKVVDKDDVDIGGTVDWHAKGY